MVESTIRPKRIEIRKAEWSGHDLYLYVYLRENLATRTVTDPVDPSAAQTLYTYDEFQVRVPVPGRMRRAANFAEASRRHAHQAALKQALHKVMASQSAAANEMRTALQSELTTKGLRLVRRRRELEDAPAALRSKIISALTSRAEWAKKELALTATGGQ